MFRLTIVFELQADKFQFFKWVKKINDLVGAILVFFQRVSAWESQPGDT